MSDLKSAVHEAPLQFVDPRRFKANSQVSVDDPHLRRSFRSAMDFLQAKRGAHFGEAATFEPLRRLGEAIRKYSLSRLPDLLEQLEARLVERGVQVHWARDAAEANAIFLAIAQAHQAKAMIKGKSMVSEEIELNHRMAEDGVACLESDMGEYIVQLAGERPSHIIMPAIHKTKQQIGQLFAEHIADTGYTEDVDALIAIGRKVLRAEFRDTPIGVSGVNFMVAETGSLVLVENEGNGRMCTTVPGVHIAITGIEKVVERFEHVLPLYSLLTRSATGQAITTYLNVITGPRRAGELDGPKEVHLVLLDNGRSQAYRDATLRATLQCIRCGACMNHCPVYARIGGLAYGTTYPGPIGSIISPHLMGLDPTQDLPTASSLCGACTEVCPVGIPITDLLTTLRHAAKHEALPGHAPLVGQGSAADWREAWAWKAWAWLNTHPTLYRIAMRLGRHVRGVTPAWQGGWTAHRTPMRLAARGLRDRLAAVDKG
ncbi:putative oxidoreductase subunit with NAD(P)-binding domain and ferridoxin-like domain [Rubrivivax sp. A210]|uniref:LutB/LldF family L-lactate oxidation iron-sulfur protein n=1 Tax=Rubrivivax sp. A210 TaxID=2772301 RepID=UPI00191AD2F8|nr:LutB/LldF family L-lactate oxidation iron-sulfur protein [Rubrivivax sp. A210]CAD5373111.1 putative oxidoreductase subunit with NAD(P)-binding domain and ferridoxin-like domain [Rubrivivax sp. A210]